MSEAALVELSGVVAGYGRSTALDGVELDVRAGEIVALLGANGAGKTTTLRVISGIVPTRGGEVRIDGRRVERHGPRDAVRMGIAHSPEGRRVFPALSVRENIELGAAPLPKGERSGVVEEMIALFPVLAERASQAGMTLSGGEQQMLAVARALASRPRLLMLDEPSLGLAPLIVRQVADLVADLRARGTTVLLVEQNAALALKLADRAFILEGGRVTLAGPAAELARDPKVREAYLGAGRMSRRRTRGAASQASPSPSPSPSA